MRAANDQNQRLSKALKQKDSLIEKLLLEKMLQRQQKQTMKQPFHHFQEVSDIISEEESAKGGVRSNNNKLDVVATMQIISPTMLDSEIVNKQTSNRVDESTSLDQ